MKTPLAIFLTLLCLISVSFSSAQDTTQPDSCPGAVPSRLVNGARGRVLPGAPNRLRAEPSTASEILAEIPAGETVAVLDGPSCAENIAWWQVRYHDQTGWTAEGADDAYWIEPSLLPDLEPITAANANRLQPIAMLGVNLINEVAWSPDGNILLAAGSAGLWRFDLTQTDMPPYLVEGYEGFFRTVAYSPDGKFAATDSDTGAIRLWDTATWTESAVLRESGAVIRKLTFSADGTRLAAGDSDGIVQMWEIETQALLVKHGLGRSISVYAFSSDLSLAFADQQILNVNEGTAIQLAGIGSILTADFTPDDQLIATGNSIHQGNYDGGQLNLWLSEAGAETGERIAEIFVGSQDISTVAFGAGDTLLASGGGNIFVWKISDLLAARQTDNRVQDAAELAIKSFPGMPSFVLSPDRKTAAYIYSDAVTLIDLDTGHPTTLKIPLVIPGIDGPVFSMALSPTEPLLAFGSGRNILLWNLDTGVEQNVLTGHMVDVLTLDFSPDGQKLVSGGANLPVYGNPQPEENAVRLWDVHAKNRYPAGTVLPGYSNVVDRVKFSPDGSAVAAWGYFGSALGVWDTRTAKQRFYRGNNVIDSIQVAFSADSQLLAFHQPTSETGLNFYDAADGKFQFQLVYPEAEPTPYPFLYPTFSPDGSYLATIDNGAEKVVLWDAHTWKIHGMLDGDAPLTFSPDGALMGFVRDENMVVWAIDAGVEKFVIPDTKVVPVFSPDSSILIANKSALWDTETGKKLVDIDLTQILESERWENFGSICGFSADMRVIACRSAIGVGLWGISAN